jgi:hypothetical protein
MPNRTSKRGKDDRAAALRALTRAKLHLVPGALERAPTAIREHFDSPWAPVEVFKQQLRPFPAGLLRLWAAQEPARSPAGLSRRG